MRGYLISLKSLSYQVNDWHFMGAPLSVLAKSVYYIQSKLLQAPPFAKQVMSTVRATELESLPPFEKSSSG